MQKHFLAQIAEYLSAASGFSHNAKRFLLSGFLQGLGGGMLATVFGIYIKTAGLGESVIGDIEAVVAFAAAVVSILGTPLVRVLGYRVLMVFAVLLIVLARFGMAAFPMTGALLALALSVGLGDGFMRTIASAFMSSNSENKERAHLFSVEFLVRVSAGFLGGLAGGAFPTLLGRWMPEVATYQWTIVVGSVLVGIGILPLLGLKDRRKNERVKVKHAYVSSVREFTSWNKVFRLIGPQAAISLGGGMVIPFVPLYLKSHLGASIGEVGAILGFSSLVTAVGAFGTPVIARKFGLGKGVALMQGLSVPFLAAVALSNSLPIAIAALWVRGTFMNMAGPMYNQMSMEGLPEHEKPLVAGWMFFGLNVMWLLGNVLGGRLMEFSYITPYMVAVALYTVGATSTYLLWRKHAPAPVAEPQLEAAAA